MVAAVLGTARETRFPPVQRARARGFNGTPDLGAPN
jgi:hypothetical protein